MDQLQQVSYLALLFVFGLIFGSFGNVVIWRLPRGESLSGPPSHCPECGHPIRPRDNVPLVSWLLLRGRCRDCGAAISPRYPTIELVSGVLWLSAGLLFGISWSAAAAVCLFYLLLLLAAIDLDVMRLPNPLVAAIAVVGVTGALASQFTGVRILPLIGVASSGLLAQPLAASLLGALLGAGVPALIGLAYAALRGRSGFGMGDFKLLGAAGFFLGAYVLLAFFFATVLGAVFGIALVRPAVAEAAVASGEGEGAAEAPDAEGEVPPGPKGIMQARFPFGLFLAFGILAAVVWGPYVWRWYTSLIGIG